ncbi:hypothetical protein LTR70_006920 [Exophiala xenobiotica]|uniref:Nephrocystin 3-like N-terminal domain-containing protein n=1 Tax=Lithohypha guttulata TaxID=1690604 RepID=A0ABR0K5L7_9EURO|nr:hypothetical protein LTR24_006571 [Lithohypha guttulata]KAK5314958.1 hypothetical protein LTR70_006920 [Exophiala xenobiotica]
MATVSAQGHHFGPITAQGNSNLTLGNVCIQNILQSGDRVSSNEAKQKAIVSALTYPGMSSRRNQLANCRAKHLDWIWNSKGVRSTSSNPLAVFDDTVRGRCAGFVEWLRNDEPIFWISGKPGSGKSILMNYLSQQHQCKDILLQRGGDKWHVIHFFFDYRSGKNIANSVEGMLRSLLAQLAKASDEVSQYITSTDFGQYLDVDSDNLACDSLQDTIFCSVNTTGGRVCMFIDGLDEFEGVHHVLIERLKELANGRSVKLCVAGRPEPLFQKSFEKMPSIVMQDFNYDTITAYATELLSEPAKYLSDGRFFKHLVRKIAVDSAGVFLWAYLVCNDVLEGMISEEDNDGLQIRIASYPTELDQLYERLLQKSDPRFKPEFMVLLRLIDKPGRFSLVDLNHLCVGMQTLAKQGILDTNPRHYLSLEDFRKRLKSRLGALVDIVDGKAVRLLHKTLHTFLEKSMNWTSNLPSKFQSTYPDEVWFRLSCHILTTSTLSQRLCLEQFVQFAYLLKEKWQQASTTDDGCRTLRTIEEALIRDRGETVRVYSANLNVFPDELATEFDATFKAMLEVESHVRLRLKEPIFEKLALRALVSNAYCLHPTQIVWSGYASLACFCQSGSVDRLLEALPTLWEWIHRWLLEDVMNDEDLSRWPPTYDGRRIPTEPHRSPHRVSLMARVMMPRGERFIEVFGRPAKEHYCPAARSTFDKLQPSVDKDNAVEEEEWRRSRAMRMARLRRAQHHDSGREGYQAKKKKKEEQGREDVDDEIGSYLAE